MDIHVFTVFRKNSLTLIFRKIANTNKTKQKKQNKTKKTHVTPKINHWISVTAPSFEIKRKWMLVLTKIHAEGQFKGGERDTRGS